MDVFFKILKKWKWKVDFFLKKLIKSVEVDSGKVESTDSLWEVLVMRALMRVTVL